MPRLDSRNPDKQVVSTDDDDVGVDDVVVDDDVVENDDDAHNLESWLSVRKIGDCYIKQWIYHFQQKC